MQSWKMGNNKKKRFIGFMSCITSDATVVSSFSSVKQENELFL